MNTFQALNDYHENFVKRKFPDIVDWKAPLRHLKKEIDEAIDSGKKEEFVDILLLLMSSYRLRFPDDIISIDLMIAAMDKLTEMENREWGSINPDGYQEHIR